MQVVRTRRGARIVVGDVVMSEVVGAPGPTHSVFDVLAACVAALAPGPRVAVLGFAGGGMVAPLRAMGFLDPVEAVDLSREGEALFRSLAGDWGGDVRVAQEDAVAWLRRRGAPFDAICEDLFVPGPGGTVKPDASLDGLPALVRDRLAPGGVAITNLLPSPGETWPSLLARVARPHRSAAVVTLEDYDNRAVVAGEALPDAREISRRLHAALCAVGSSQAGRIAVRTLVRREKTPP